MPSEGAVDLEGTLLEAGAFQDAYDASVAGDTSAYDDASVATARIVSVAVEILEEILELEEANNLDHTRLTQADIDALKATVETGRQLFEREDVDAVWRDISRCEDALLEDLANTVARVGPCLGIDVEYPMEESQ